MNSSIINKLIKGRVSGVDVQKNIEMEVDDYLRLMKRVGATVNLHFHEDERILVDSNAAIKLLSEVLIGNISSPALAYICDCFTLSETIEFQNELIKEIVFEIADPEINGGYKSKAEIEDFLHNLIPNL
jgi:hypothetical protein